jgi:hypothetical protein
MWDDLLQSGRPQLIEEAIEPSRASHTAADEVVAVIGSDWSSELPYYAGRHGLILPD